MMIVHNITDDSKNLYSHPSSILFRLKLVFYALTFLAGTLGNSMVCLVVCKQRKMQTVTNYFLVNLAVSDLAVLVICIPFDFGEQVAGNWPYGSFLCQIIYPLQTMSTTASVSTLVAISINRYMAIVHPLKNQLTPFQAKIIITIVWCFSLVSVSPFMAVLHMDRARCIETWDIYGLNPKAYTIYIFLSTYIIPLFIIMVAYIRISKELRKRDLDYESSELRREHDRETNKVVKMLIIVVIVFAILMLPIHVVYTWYDYGNGGNSAYFIDVLGFCQICIYVNSTTNPIIYNVCNENFRDGFKLYFGHCFRLALGSRRINSKQNEQAIVLTCNGYTHAVNSARSNRYPEYVTWEHGDQQENTGHPHIVYISTV